MSLRRLASKAAKQFAAPVTKMPKVPGLGNRQSIAKTALAPGAPGGMRGAVKQATGGIKPGLPGMGPV